MITSPYVPREVSNPMWTVKFIITKPREISTNLYLTKIMHESSLLVLCTCICKFKKAIQPKPNGRS